MHEDIGKRVITWIADYIYNSPFYFLSSLVLQRLNPCSIEKRGTCVCDNNKDQARIIKTS